MSVDKEIPLLGLVADTHATSGAGLMQTRRSVSHHVSRFFVSFFFVFFAVKR